VIRILPLLLLLLFSCAEETVKKEPLLCTLPPTAYNPWLYTAHETHQDPVIDGNPLEKTWQIVRWNKHYADSTFEYKILWSYDLVFILAKVPLEQVKKRIRTSADVSVYKSDSLLYCRLNSLLKPDGGYDYEIKEEKPFLYIEIKLRDLIEKDSILLDNQDISISYSCEENQKEKVKLQFVR